ncbi:MAG: helix-turn-helix domain-containing protein [Dehalococcoidales bacterium]|nr:helix-turn-helix domain-containing protein [Dehalococcoidales bacterium]
MATVEETWQIALPPGSRLIAGGSGLGREVHSTTRLSPRPPGFDTLEGGEVAFVALHSLYSLDENLTLAAVITHLDELGASAVAILGEEDEDARATADRLALPLISLPPGSRLGEVEQRTMRVIMESQADLYRRAQDAYRQLTELAIEGRGLTAIVERLAQIVGKPVAMEDAAGQLQVFASPREGRLSRQEASGLLADRANELTAWFAGLVLSASDPPVAEMDLPGQSLARLVAPIVSRNRVGGFLSLIGKASRFGEVERVAVARGAAACAIELARQHAAMDAQDQLQIGVLDELLAGNGGDLEAVRERALRLGYDLAAPHAALVFQTAEGGPEGEATALLGAVEREVSHLRIKAPLRARGPSVAVLYPLEDTLSEAALKKMAESLRSAVASRLGRQPVCVGLGRLYGGLEGLRTAHQEAEQALLLGMLVFGGGRTVYFGELGLYRLLFNIKAREELQAFHDEMLGRVIDYDRRNNAELLSTLAAYFAARNSPTEAAERMHLHRNTFLYRLHRIREITGLDLDDPETRLSLHLALRIRETLLATQTRPLEAIAGPARPAFPRTAGAPPKVG